MFPQRGTNAHFLNMQISVTNEVDGEFRTHKFDKRRNLPFKYSQYLQFRSNRSVSQSYNIIQSQAFPILYLSSNVHDVLNELENLLQILTANGFRRYKSKSRLLKFLRQGSFPGIRFDLVKVIQDLERSVVPSTFKMDCIGPNILKTLYLLNPCQLNWWPVNKLWELVPYE